MRKFTIKKKSGGSRLIYAPNRREKARLRLMVPGLNDYAVKHCDQEVVHGFMPCKSPVTNALKHVGPWQFTMSFDLADFFDSVTTQHLTAKQANEISALPEVNLGCLFPDNAAHQGLPTSPVVANIAAAALDTKILELINGLQIVYTRYADDLTFSFNDKGLIGFLKDGIPATAGSCQFKVNEKKTRVQYAGFGRRIITGVAVDDKGIYPTRAVRRRLRAALHQGKRWHAMGLAEWCKLKTPNPNGSTRHSKVMACVGRHLARQIAGMKDVWRT